MSADIVLVVALAVSIGVAAGLWFLYMDGRDRSKRKRHTADVVELWQQKRASWTPTEGDGIRSPRVRFEGRQKR